jgi:hypothetical protein
MLTILVAFRRPVQAKKKEERPVQVDEDGKIIPPPPEKSCVLLPLCFSTFSSY